jgi:hypothetical protein
VASKFNLSSSHNPIGSSLEMIISQFRSSGGFAFDKDANITVPGCIHRNCPGRHQKCGELVVLESRYASTEPHNGASREIQPQNQ